MTATGFFETENIRRAALLGLGALVLYAFPAIWGHPLAETPETRIAVVAREMVASGNWAVPTLGGKPRLIKPPLPYWIAAATAKVLGSDGSINPGLYARSVQLPSAIFAALTVFIVALYAGARFGRVHGWLTGVRLATMSLPFSVMPFQFALLGYADVGLMFFATGMCCCAAEIWAAERPKIGATIGFGIFLGLAILQKWFVPIMLLGLPMAYMFFTCKAGRIVRTVCTAAGFLIAALMMAPWLFLLEKRLPGGLQLMWEGIRECSSAIGHIHKDRWYYYVYVLLGGTLPWTLDGILAVAFGGGAALRRALHRRELQYFALTAALGFVVFYANAKQQGYYLLPLYPAIAITGGVWLAELWADRKIRIMCHVMAVVGMICAIVFGVALTLRTRAEDLPLANLKSRLDALPPDIEIYVAGLHESKQWHYLGRNYKTLFDLAQEKPNASAQRILVATKSDIDALKMRPHLAPLPGQQDESITVAAMQPDADWAGIINAARKARQKSNQEGE